ncbi:HAD family phosphatase [Flavitalea sp. BT771]|uniref:HAD family hydrolase n=1 Tax=Flavitalea sp. BT771 TaxID=3063329 RepID=UPI0026E26D41|nr:HAD family phosphatase [Flavitalea sp. BT771]MDO6434448.1 HAD family phosphatase [Flavitalea sp. BT771]MDV6223348.1 HAD family phosphatase [Flavitalea sp. BT771]
MATIDTVVFDLGGVLVDWNPDYLYKEIFPGEEERKWFLSNICTLDWNEEQDAGRTLKEGTEYLVRKYPEHEKYIRMYYDRWKEMLGGPIHETVEIFRHLKEKSKVRLYALTNWSAETFPIALELYEFLHWFDGRLVSGAEKIRKPSPDIYKLLIRRFDIDPSRAVYVDDNLRNVTPAKALGFYGIHFQSPGQFRQELEQLGVW